MDYTKAIPNRKIIDKINKLYYTDNKIIIWTSRGVGTGKNLRRMTVKQLKEWGVRYHKLRMDKPLYDYFIDDKAINIKDF